MRYTVFGSSQHIGPILHPTPTVLRGSFDSVWVTPLSRGDTGQWASGVAASGPSSSGWGFYSDLSTGAAGLGPAVVQDATGISGASRQIGYNNGSLVFRVGADIPLTATVSYVKLMLRAGTTTYTDGVWGDGPTSLLRPYYVVIGSAGDSSTSIVGGANGFLGGYIPTSANLSGGVPDWNFPKYISPSLTVSPYGGAFTGEVLRNTGWGVLLDPTYITAKAHITEVALEVGWDYAAFVVATSEAVPTPTTATLNGFVDPSGDSPTTWFFEWGQVGGLFTYTTTPTQFTGGAAREVSAAISGLTSGATYTYRIAATGSDGVTHYGVTRTFMATTVSPVFIL